MDCTFGGTTLVVHVPATTRPGAPKRPEYVKAEVYFPGHLAREDTRYSEAVSHIVQKFITDIGIPNIARYERNAGPHWTLPPPTLIPSALPRQSLQPNASPPGSSVFTYHGERKPHVVVVSDDEDFNIATSQYQPINYSARETALKYELNSVRQTLQDVENALADSRRRENELLAEIGRLSGSPASNSRSMTPLAAHTTPRTPDRSNVTHRVKPSQAPLSPVKSLSVAATKPSHHGSFYPPTPQGRENYSQIPSFLPSPMKPDLGSDYGRFIQDNGLAEIFFTIDLIRNKVPMFLWRDELMKAGISDTILNELMSSMSSHSSDKA